MDYTHALAIAEQVHAALAPHCQRISIAGSIRRQRPQAKDIEIVCMPLQEPADLFGQELTACQGFCAVVNQWRSIRGQPTGKYTQRRLPDGITLDLFIADAENWGWQLALRTGSAAYSHEVLATGLLRAGYTMLNGYIYRRGQRLAVREEVDLFAMVGLPYTEPSDRDIRSAP